MICVQYLLIICLCLLFIRLNKKKATFCIELLLIIWTIIESVWGILQAFELEGGSSHQNNLITGSFDNPGPYGAMIAIGVGVSAALAWRLYKKRVSVSSPLYFLSLVSFIMGVMVLPASRSRAAWIGLAVSAIVFFFREVDLADWVSKHRIISAGSMAVALLLLTSIFLMKTDSAIGRFHIWNIECRAILAHPWTGVGFDKVFHTYGIAQAAYFQEDQRSEAIIRVAGSPTYAYNEYLKFGMAWGIGGLLLSIIVVVFVEWRLFCKNSVLAYGALIYAIFAMASYPLSVVQLKLLGAVFVAVAITPTRVRYPWLFWSVWSIFLYICAFKCILLFPQERARRNAERIWKTSPFMKQESYDLSVVRLQSLYPYLKDNYKYLFDYGYSLHKIGAFEESNAILHKGASISCDPIFHTIMAKNYLALEQFDTAERELLEAHWLIPCRIYPLLILMHMYIETNRLREAICVGQMIDKMPIYDRNPYMEVLHREAILLLSELETNIE